MQKVFENKSQQLVQIICDLLEQEQIKFTVKNFDLHRLAGEIPSQEVLPSIWVAHNDAQKAIELIKAAESTTDIEPWTCKCGETIEGQFSSCWNCGMDRP